jgi:hypothetical protein
MAEYIRNQLANHQEFIVPKLAAAALGIKEGEAFVLLRMMVDAGLLKQQYNVYCRDKDLYIESVDTLDGLDKVGYCDDCDTQHEPHELAAEIAFRPTSEVLYRSNSNLEH